MPLILGIETSCDESAAAVTDGPYRVLSSVVATQHDLHEQYAGVVPEIASRAHVQRLMPVIETAIRQAGITLQDIEAVAVGHTPGLIGSLLVGVSAAKALAWSLDRPLIGVHHLLAHLHAPSLDDEPIVFPAISLLASGGHTAVYLQTSPLEVRLLGSTIDDAVGEAFDKVSTMLDAGYPGGPAIEQLSHAGDPMAIDLPISRPPGEQIRFSYAGLKTAVLYALRGHPTGRGKDASFPRSLTDCSTQRRADLAASFQRCAIESLMHGLRRAVDEHSPASLCGGGGVLANTVLREEMTTLSNRSGATLRIPPMRYCIDNAAMIAGFAAHRLESGEVDSLSLQAQPRQPIGMTA
jgi:N6-L-threonylcarbamoyladenine synthase